MTTSRIVRGNKVRIFLYVCGVLIVTGIIACYNNTRLQLADVQKTNEQCRQHQEQLSSQIQVIFDYKQRLEKSLKDEKEEHQRSKGELESRLTDEKEEHQKVLNENKLRFTSLQQQYKLLDRQQEDLKEESSKIQSQQLKEIKSLRSKLTEVQEALDELTNKKETLENQLMHVQEDKDNADKQLEYLTSELSKAKANLQAGENLLSQPSLDLPRPLVRNINFAQQIPHGEEYEVKGNNLDVKLNGSDGKPMENENNSQRVIPLPYILNNVKSSTKMSVSKGNLVVSPLGVPTVTPETRAKTSSPSSKVGMNVLAMPNKMHSGKPNKVPNGIVPVMQQYFQSKEEKAEVVDVNLPGRYRNNVLNDSNLQKSLQTNREIDDKENGAHEIEMLNEKDNQLNLNDKIDIQNKFKQHIDNLQQPEEREEADLDKNEDVADEDEDDDIYADRQKEPPAVRI